MTSKKTLFNEQWLDLNLHLELGWLRRGRDVYHAFCDVCKKHIGLGNMGRKAVTTHSKGKQHNELIKLRNSQTSLKHFLSPGGTLVQQTETLVSNSENGVTISSVCSVPGPSCQSSSTRSTASTIESSTSIAQSDNTITSFCYKDDVSKAEIMWALNVVQKKLSLSSCGDIGATFKIMFPDSSIASKFQLGETKCSYIINHGLAPYFDSILQDQLHSCENYVICFDEALNKIVQRGQMDLFVQFFDLQTNKVRTRYYNSIFLGNSTAQHFLNGFMDGITSLDKNKILQISMDGPNVNLSFLKMFDDQLMEKCPEGKHLVNIGVCGLHVVNGALKTGIESVKWNIHLFLRDLHFLFNDSPARRAEFTLITGNSKFPLKHCSTRWLDNVKCLERALLILGDVKKFIDKSKTLQSKPYTVVVEHCNDKFLKCKLAFYKLISSDCEPFLRYFQSPDPLAPYMFSHLHDILRTLLSRIVKSSKIAAANTCAKLISIDLTDIENLRNLKTIDLGFQTIKYLKEIKTSEGDELRFRKDCQTLLVKLISKLVERSPLKYKAVRGLSSLDPAIVLHEPELGCERMKCLLEVLYESNRVSESVAEKAKKQYSLLCMDAKGVLSSEFKIFLPDTEDDNEELKDKRKLDNFFSSILAKNPKYADLWEIVKLCLIFSHGNATVEGGFSINKSLLVENLHEETIISQRKVFDAIVDARGKENIVITQKMLTAVRSSRRRYEEWLVEKRKKFSEEEKSRALKRKMQAEIKKLQESRKELRAKTLAEEEQIAAKIILLEKAKHF